MLTTKQNKKIHLCLSSVLWMWEPIDCKITRLFTDQLPRLYKATQWSQKAVEVNAMRGPSPCTFSFFHLHVFSPFRRLIALRSSPTGWHLKLPGHCMCQLGDNEGNHFGLSEGKPKGWASFLLDSTNWEQKTTDAVDKINHILGTNLKSISARKIREPLQWQQINNHFSF